VKAEHLELSKLKKAELYNFMKGTRNKEEYRRASAIKQKLEGLPYRTIAKNLDINYRNVYNWIKEYKEYGLDGIRSKRKNAGRIPKISSDKNKDRIKEIEFRFNHRNEDIFLLLANIMVKNVPTS
jgi:transposase-like protein